MAILLDGVFLAWCYSECGPWSASIRQQLAQAVLQSRPRGIRLILTRSPGDPQACSHMRSSSWSTAKNKDVGNFKKSEEKRPVGRENEPLQFPLSVHTEFS